MKKFNTWVLDTTIYILDFLYRGRDFQRFWVLEVIARAPYFSFISVLHFRESLGLRGEDHLHLRRYRLPLPFDNAASNMFYLLFDIGTKCCVNQG